MYATEFLNSLSPSGIPPHELQLAVGMPIILLRTIAPGFVNGTRLLITHLSTHLILAKVITGCPAVIGNKIFIPRIKCTVDKVLPVQIQRKQFPIRIAFAMTINKSQGQSIERVGIYLPKHCFSHGQLYVALSRAKSPGGCKLFTEDPLIPPNTTRNVVHKQIL